MGKSLDAGRRDIEQANQKREETLTELARFNVDTSVAPNEERFIPIGPKHSGDQFPAGSGFEVKRGWFGFQADKLFTHALVLGMTGAGKTYLLIRIIYGILFNTNFRLCVVDGKGSRGFALMVAHLAYLRHGKKVPVVKLGWGEDEPTAFFNVFKGGGSAIANRFGAMLGFEEDSGDSGYYVRLGKQILNLVCGVNIDVMYGKPKIEPPRTIHEMLNRITQKWLIDEYKNYPLAKMNIEAAKDAKVIDGLRTQLESYFAGFAHVVSENGVWFDDHPVVVISVRTATEKITSKNFFKLFTETMSYYMGAEADKSDTGFVLAVDEFGVLGGEAIKYLLQLGRENHVGVILASQGFSNLGDDKNLAEQIMDSTGIKFLMKSEAADEIIMRAGTVKAPEASFQLSGGDATGMASVRLQDQFKIGPNEVRELEKGLCFVSSGGRVVKAQSAEVKEAVENPDAVLTQRRIIKPPIDLQSKSSKPDTAPTKKGKAKIWEP